ncbi:MAG: hypothetical protein JXQ75_11290 [Phycisphaerae bacterium]|nr:hypothetical protein [Phycisphaerae bacterium]
MHRASIPTHHGIVSQRWDLLGATVLYPTVLVLLFCMTGLTPKHDGRGHDGIYYAAMARDEARAESFVPVAPYCYRVLTPLLSTCLPGPVVWRFRLLNLVTWASVLIVWHLLARRIGLSRSFAMFGGLLLATSAWGPAFAFYCPCYIDPLMYLFVLVGLNLMLARRTRWLAVLLPIAMLQREQCAIVWVCALVYEIKSVGWSRRLAWRYGLTLAACAGVWAALRLVITPIGSTTGAPWNVAFAVAGWLLTDPGYLFKSVLGVVYALGLPLVGLVLLPGARRYVREHRWVLYYLVCCLLSLLGGSDKARLAFLAQPVLLLVFLHGLQPLLSRPGARIVPAVLLVVHLYAQFPPSLMLSGGVLDAPLVDTMERSSHGATVYEQGHWPVPMAVIAGHVALSVAFMSAMLMALLPDARRIAARLAPS